MVYRGRAVQDDIRHHPRCWVPYAIPSIIEGKPDTVDNMEPVLYGIVRKILELKGSTKKGRPRAAFPDEKDGCLSNTCVGLHIVRKLFCRVPVPAAGWRPSTLARLASLNSNTAVLYTPETYFSVPNRSDQQIGVALFSARLAVDFAVLFRLLTGGLPLCSAGPVGRAGVPASIPVTVS